MVRYTITPSDKERPMRNVPRTLQTRSGLIQFPAFIPVATFDENHPLDTLLRHYLRHLAQAVMVSYQYARKMKDSPQLPLWVDSGGFASLLRAARITKSGQLGTIEINI